MPDSAKTGWLSRLKIGLSKSRQRLGQGLSGLMGRRLDEAAFEELEELLITADVGVKTTARLMERLRQRARAAGLADTSGLKPLLREELVALLSPLERDLSVDAHRPSVILFVGVNGAGKTTTIGKLASRFLGQGKSVLLAAGDTFRAAAVGQLMTWGERNGVTVIAQEKGDSAAVIFDAMAAAQARGVDVLLADTAGRLPTQLNLMEEIRKVKRVVEKADATAPHEVLLVLDANTGQNALSQVKAFHEALGLTGLIVTKLDGTARGGVLAALAGEFGLPVLFIGVGEKMEDLEPFNATAFVDALLDD
jgi:fused signal recognition particle receptor